MKTIIIILVLVIVIMGIAGTVFRAIAVNAINSRLDSSEQILLNEIDSRLYRDFNRKDGIQPTDLDISSNSIAYSLPESRVKITNNGDNEILFIIMDIGSGSTWSGSIAGTLKVKSIEMVNIQNDIKIDLTKTPITLYAVEYNISEKAKGRRSLNRDYIRYLSVGGR